MSKEEGQRKSNILTIKSSAATQELNKDEKNKLNRIVRSSDFQKRVGVLNEQEGALISKLIKEGADMEKLYGEIGKLRAEAKAKNKPSEMKSAKFNSLIRASSTAVGMVYNVATGAITDGKNAVNPEKALEFADAAFQVVGSQPDAGSWLRGVRVAAGLAAKNLAVKRKVTKDMVDSLKTLVGSTDTVLIDDGKGGKRRVSVLDAKIIKTIENFGGTMENIKQIIKYYPDGS